MKEPMHEEEVRFLAGQIVAVARSLYERGYTFGTAGNLSARLADRMWITPTNSSFASLSADALSLMDLSGNHLSGPKPSKEWPFHLAAYEAVPGIRAVLHLHATYSTAVSCLRELDMNDALPVFTPYYAMRLPSLPVIPYFPPGDNRLAMEVRARLAGTKAVLLRNHGSITVGATLEEASALAEELEEQAKLYFLLRGAGQPLSEDEISELRRRFR